MVIKVLAENTALSEAFRTEHGLSLYIETDKHKILFDVGKSNVFLKNAQQLNVDIGGIDFVVISHGHVDHGGGLKYFLKENTRAPIYVHPKALQKYYSKRQNNQMYIGLVQDYKKNDRFIFTSERFFIDKGIELFSNVQGSELKASSNQTLSAEIDGKLVPDMFEHEQNLVIAENGKLFLFAGCAHNGIVNITNHLRTLKKKDADYVLGGFHLYSQASKKSEEPGLVRKIGETLKNTGSKYYTCHCTGLESYGLLKDIMGDKVEYLASGSILNL